MKDAVGMDITTGSVVFFFKYAKPHLILVEDVKTIGGIVVEWSPEANGYLPKLDNNVPIKSNAFRGSSVVRVF